MAWTGLDEYGFDLAAKSRVSYTLKQIELLRSDFLTSARGISNRRIAEDFQELVGPLIGESCDLFGYKVIEWNTGPRWTAPLLANEFDDTYCGIDVGWHAGESMIAEGPFRSNVFLAEVHQMINDHGLLTSIAHIDEFIRVYKHYAGRGEVEVSLIGLWYAAALWRI